MFLTGYVISCEHMYEDLYKFMGGILSSQSLPCMFCSYWFSASGDIKYLMCHVTSQNHVIKGSSNLMSRK